LVGSVTKQFTAAAILLLEEAGQLSVDDPLSRFIVGVPAGDSITIHQLLSHTSGVARDPFPDYPDQVIARTLKEVVEAISLRPREFAPGARMSYSNGGYVLLAAVIEAVSGVSYSEFLRNRILEPLGMHNSGILPAHGRLPGMATGYDPAPSPDFVEEAPYFHPMNSIGANGLVTTITDLFRWNQALHAGQLLKPETRDRMFTPHPGGRGYGVGVFRRLGRDVIGHDGVTNGFTAFLNHFVDEDITIMYAGNIRSGTLSILESALAAEVFGESFDPYEPPNLAKQAPGNAGQHAGVYELFPGFNMDVTCENGNLELTGTGGYPTWLAPIEDGGFFYRAMYAEVRFEEVEDGRRLVWVDRNGSEYPAKLTAALDCP
ncbi:MAG: beta-lactamase family protein, partial [Rhodothermales bacterium]|nr:beta-lactamase family protein [Rhodothermales bacterium]